jgi:hypothetical protein
MSVWRLCLDVLNYLGTYTPLCGGNWDIAALNLSVVSYGRQFDRLGVNHRGQSAIDPRACGLEIRKFGEPVQQNQYGPEYIFPLQRMSPHSKRS